jgi:hypothetical protein
MPYEHALLYIQILLAVLLFALGIPALIVEAAVEDRIRHILHKRRPYRVVTGLLIATVIVVMSLLWLARVEQVIERRAPKNAEVPATSVPSQDNEAKMLRAPIAVAGVRIDTATKVATGLLIVAFAWTWWMMMRHDVETELVRRIKRRIAWRFRWHGHYADDDLRDLLSIGGHGAAGHEKRVVIQTLGNIAAKIQNAKNYGGSELSGVIRGFLDIVAAAESRGDEGNLIECLEELQLIRSRLLIERLANESDAIVTIHVASRLGEIAVAIKSDAAAFQALSVAEDVPQLAFRIGREAVKAERFRVAVTCLTRLDAIRERTRSVPKELVALVAQFHAAGGSARAFAEGAVSALSSAILVTAYSEYYEEGDFTIADQVQTLRATTTRRTGIKGYIVTAGILALAAVALTKSR